MQETLYTARSRHNDAAGNTHNADTTGRNGG